VSKKFPTWDELGAWRRLRCYIEYAGLSFAAWLIPLLPWSVLRAFARLLGGLVYHLDARGRSYALSNLQMAFGGGKSPAEIRRIAKDSYRQFGRTMLELFWVRNYSRGSYRRLVEIEGYDKIRKAHALGGGVIGVCLHYANFEWLSLTGGFEVTQGVIVTQKFRNPLLGPIFDRLRSSGGHRIIQQERSLITTLKHLKAGGSVGILVDLQLDPREPSVPVKSFGRWCPMTKMHAILHKHTGYPIVPFACVPLPDGRYRMVAHEPLVFPAEASEQEIAQRCWDVLEPDVRRHPEAWLWAYKHWRFIPEGEDPSRYPFYASRQAAFDELMKAEVAGRGPAAEHEA
jgi:KDO2-lipid IV(A) lauroyltransferase